MTHHVHLHRQLRSPGPMPACEFEESARREGYPFPVRTYALDLERPSHLNLEPVGGIMSLRLCEGSHRLLSWVRTTRVLEGEVSFLEGQVHPR